MNFKKRKILIIGFLPNLVMSLIFEFSDNETLWLNIPLTCKRFKEILDNDIVIMNRKCEICYINFLKEKKQLIDWVQKYYPIFISNIKKNKKTLFKSKFRKKNGEITERVYPKKKYIKGFKRVLNWSFNFKDFRKFKLYNGYLKRVYNKSKQRYMFVCGNKHKYYDLCKENPNKKLCNIL